MIFLLKRTFEKSISEYYPPIPRAYTLPIMITGIQYGSCSQLYFAFLEYACSSTIVFGSLLRKVLKLILHLDSQYFQLLLISYSEVSSLLQNYVY